MRRLILTHILLFFTLIGSAQISTEEEPISWSIIKQRSNFNPTPVVEMKRLDFAKLQKEDEQDETDGIPPSFGAPEYVDLNLNNSGTWTTLTDGSRIWKLEIYSPDALSLNLLYDKYVLPKGGKLFIYASDHSESIGAFTDLNNREDKKFATDLIYSNRITLEYYEPAKVTGQGEISISCVVSGYRFLYIQEKMNAFAASGSCQVDINCSEGADWQNEKRAVALIIVNGTKYCTGFLVNNTREDFTPYFMTANHCLTGGDAISSPSLGHYVFRWAYEAPSCGSTVGVTGKSTTGATIVANYDVNKSDFALLKLSEDPKNLSDFTPYYLGWDTRFIDHGRGAVGIHHPSGDVKKSQLQPAIRLVLIWKDNLHIIIGE